MEKGIEIRDIEGNIFYPKTNSSLVRYGDNNVGNQIDNINKKLNDISNIQVNISGINSKNLAGVLQELFTNADNGRKSIAQSIGSPLSANDTFIDQRRKIDQLREYFSNTLKSKNITCGTSDSFESLIDKLKSIELKDYKIGELIPKQNTSIIPMMNDCFSLDKSMTSMIFESSNNNIYLTRGGEYNIFKKYDNTGKLLWQYNNIDDISSNIYINNNEIYFEDGDNIFIINNDGKLIYKIETNNRGNLDAIYACNNKLYTLFGNELSEYINGKCIWSKKLNSNEDFIYLKHTHEDNFLLGSFNSIQKINRAGTVIWNYKINVDNVVFDDSDSTFVYDGDAIKKININGQYMYSIPFSHIKIMFIDDYNYLYLISDNTVIKLTNNGNIDWKYENMYKYKYSNICCDKAIGNVYIYEDNNKNIKRISEFYKIEI